MNRLHRRVALVIGCLTIASSAMAQTPLPGTSEFGLTSRELSQNIEKVEARIAQCMREQGFEYFAVDAVTVRRGMGADKSLPGLSEEEFIESYGYGVATMYTGIAPQLVDGYSPGRIGLGDQNVQAFKNLSPTDQVAYNRALLGEHTDATFAVSLELENFARCGGCTRKAIEKVFKPEQLKATYYNPLNAMINKDPRMRAALRKYADAMREAGFDYSHPDDVETDIRQRLDVITRGGTIPVAKMTPDQLAALEKLQETERRVAVLDFEFAEEYFEPVEEQIEKELYARPVQ